MPRVLRYPYEAITENTDYLQLTIKKYEAGDVQESPSYGVIQNVRDAGSSASTGNPNPAQIVDDGIILLPIPANIQDGNNVGYGPDTLDAPSALAAKALTAAVGTSAGALNDLITRGNVSESTINQSKQNVQQLLSEAGAQSPELLDYVAKTFTAKAASIIPGVNVTGKQLLTRGTGKILNPNMELLFNGVNLRTFNFQFKLTPRDDTEAGQVKSIIRSLKKNMAPKVDSARTFLSTPNIFEPVYRKGNLNHPFLHKFKQCALTSMSVNYTGEGVYATYEDGTPISTLMNLSFQELAPIYDKDYNNLNREGEYTDSFDEWSLAYRPRQQTEGVGY